MRSAATNRATKLLTAALVSWCFIAPALALADSGDYGKQVYHSKDFKLYYRVNEDSVVFSALLPPKWSYSLNIDVDRNGIWGYGAANKKPGGTSHIDRSYAQLTNSSVCVQWIYNAYPGDPNSIKDSSPCGGFKSKASIHTRRLSDDQDLKTYTIPKSELQHGKGPIHIVVAYWDGHKGYFINTLAHPWLLKL